MTSIKTIIELFYYTGWDSPMIHYTSGHKGNWIQRSLEATSKSQWFKIVLNDYPQNGIEFVISDKSKTYWDNPSYTSTQKVGRNYFIVPLASGMTWNDSSISNGIERYTLVNGVITHIKGPSILLATDLDGTLLGHDVYLSRFNEIWLQRHVWRGSCLVYTTGRNLKDFLCAAACLNLLQPDFAICGVGTEIYSFSNHPSASNSVIALIKPLLNDFVSSDTTNNLDPLIQDANLQCPQWCPSRQNATFDPDWLKSMRTEFHRPNIERIVRSLPGEFYINGNIYHDPWRLSVSARLSDIVKLSQSIPADNLENQNVGSIGLTVTSDSIETPAHEVGFKHLMRVFDGYKLLLSGRGEFRYLDILPKSAGKLAPLEFLMKKTGFNSERTLVCGDSGNDVDMFAHPRVRGVCVANSQDELKEFLQGKEGLATLRGLKPTPYVFFSSQPCAGAILEALEHFKFDDFVLYPPRCQL